MKYIYDFWLTFHGHLADPERFPIAGAAIILMAIWGIVTGNLGLWTSANPLLWKITDKLFSPLGLRLDRKDRKAGDLIFRGFLVSILAILLAYAAAQLVSYYVQTNAYSPIFETIALAVCLTCGAVWHMLMKLYRTIEQNQAGAGAYLMLSRSARTDFSSADNYTITRAGMACAAKSFDKGLVAPVLWYLLLGIPGAFIYTVIAALAWRFGKGGFTSGFGAVPLAFEKLLGFVPSILAGVFILLASLPTPSASMGKSISLAFGLLLRKIKKGVAKYEQGGFPLTAMAWTLNVALGGPAKTLSGESLKFAWVGPEKATAQIDHTHLRRAILIHMGATLLFLAALGGAYVWGELLLDFPP